MSSSRFNPKKTSPEYILKNNWQSNTKNFESSNRKTAHLIQGNCYTDISKLLSRNLKSQERVGRYILSGDRKQTKNTLSGKVVPQR